MKILRVGDPHVKFNNLEDCEKLLHYVEDLIRRLKPDRVEILGDLFHTHYVIRLEVLAFWDAWLQVLSDQVELVVLEGNHDQYGDTDAKFGTIRIFKHIKDAQNCPLRIVDAPCQLGIFGYMPHTSNKKKFVEDANYMESLGVKVLVCHQTFKGNTYETGFPAPDGIELSEIKIPLVISGHIHTHQEIDKLINPGTPKWDTVSDANMEKGIWYYEHDDITGAITKKEFYSSSAVISPLISLAWREGEPQPVFPENAKATIELVGRSEWINQQKAKLKGTVNIRSKITDKVKTERRQAGKNLASYVMEHFDPIEGITKENLLNYMKEIQLV